MYALRRPRPAALARLRREQEGQPLTYDEVGMSLADEVPSGPWSVASVALEVGRGNAGLLLARRAIRAWAGHDQAGVVLEPERPAIAEGEVLALAAPVLGPWLPVAGLWLTAACRVVRVVDDDDAFGFAYGTLPHHPEVGEESFVARRHPDGSVTVEVRVVSATASRLARLGGPVSLRLRDGFLRRYAVGLAASVAAAS